MVIKILGKKYITMETETIKPGELILGEVNFLDQKISIYTHQTEESKKITLLHEIIHGIFNQLGFEQENDNEHLIKSLSESLYQVLLENKELLSFLGLSLREGASSN